VARQIWPLAAHGRMNSETGLSDADNQPADPEAA
jgi:hypothetical protein